MLCLYCHKRLLFFGLFKDEPFCSPEHQKKYYAEQSQKVFQRLADPLEKPKLPGEPAKEEEVELVEVVATVAATEPAPEETKPVEAGPVHQFQASAPPELPQVAIEALVAPGAGLRLPFQPPIPAFVAKVPQLREPQRALSPALSDPGAVETTLARCGWTAAAPVLDIPLSHPQTATLQAGLSGQRWLAALREAARTADLSPRQPVSQPDLRQWRLHGSRHLANLAAPASWPVEVRGRSQNAPFGVLESTPIQAPLGFPSGIARSQTLPGLGQTKPLVAAGGTVALAGSSTRAGAASIALPLAGPLRFPEASGHPAALPLLRQATPSSGLIRPLPVSQPQLQAASRMVAFVTDAPAAGAVVCALPLPIARVTAPSGRLPFSEGSTLRVAWIERPAAVRQSEKIHAAPRTAARVDEGPLLPAAIAASATSLPRTGSPMSPKLVLRRRTVPSLRGEGPIAGTPAAVGLPGPAKSRTRGRSLRSPGGSPMTWRRPQRPRRERWAAPPVPSRANPAARLALSARLRRRQAGRPLGASLRVAEWHAQAMRALMPVAHAAWSAAAAAALPIGPLAAPIGASPQHAAARIAPSFAASLPLTRVKFAAPAYREITGALRHLALPCPPERWSPYVTSRSAPLLPVWISKAPARYRVEQSNPFWPCADHVAFQVLWITRPTRVALSGGLLRTAWTNLVAHVPLPPTPAAQANATSPVVRMPMRLGHGFGVNRTLAAPIHVPKGDDLRTAVLALEFKAVTWRFWVPVTTPAPKAPVFETLAHYEPWSTLPRGPQSLEGTARLARQHLRIVMPAPPPTWHEPNVPASSVLARVWALSQGPHAGPGGAT